MYKRRFLAIIPFASIMVVAVLLQKATSGQQASPDELPSEKVFKNVQVLKGYPANQLYSTMQFMNESLGVSCEYCHVTNAYEKDDKKVKKIARQMILLQRSINRDHFGGRRRVTCYSCHRGALDVPQR